MLRAPVTAAARPVRLARPAPRAAPVAASLPARGGFRATLRGAGPRLELVGAHWEPYSRSQPEPPRPVRRDGPRGLVTKKALVQPAFFCSAAVGGLPRGLLAGSLHPRSPRAGVLPAGCFSAYPVRLACGAARVSRPPQVWR